MILRLSSDVSGSVLAGNTTEDQTINDGGTSKAAGAMNPTGYLPSGVKTRNWLMIGDVDHLRLSIDLYSSHAVVNFRQQADRVKRRVLYRLQISRQWFSELCIAAMSQRQMVAL